MIIKDLISFTRQSTYRIIEEIKGYEILKGARGQKGVDIEKLAESIERISQIIVDLEDIKGIDINPIVANEENSFANKYPFLIIFSTF